MDFETSAEGSDAAELTRRILGDLCTPERLREIETGTVRFDHDLWRALADAGLLTLCVGEDWDGAGLGLLELCRVLIEVGTTVAPVPLREHGITAMALDRFGSPAHKSRWLRLAASGEGMLTVALAEEREHAPRRPVTTAEHTDGGWQIDGGKAVVPSGPLADLVLVMAETSDGPTWFKVHPDDPGVTITPQRMSGDEVKARVELDHAFVTEDRVLGEVGGGEALREWLVQHLTVALCAEQVGTLQGALDLTAAYAREREQFGRPIGSFQAVGQRLADAYIDVLGARLTMWQAAWRLSEGLPAAQEVAAAKLWAADAGHRVAHTCVHIHGGVGIDLDGQAHRYFTALKRHEFSLGGATEQARQIGGLLAGEPA